MELTYPGYMNRPPQVLEGVSGDVSAPAGTQVKLKARADRPVQSARLLLPQGDVPLRVVPPRQLEGTLVMSQSGRYRLAVVDLRGHEVVEQEGHQLTVEADAPPTVELQEPAEDKTVLSTEKVPIRFKCRDDFGLTEVDLVVRIMRRSGEPVRKSLGTFRDDPKEHAGHATLDIAALEALPGDRLVVAVEAKDNDTVQGPKAGLSPSRTLKVFSAAEHHAELIAKQEELLRRLVVQLADEMELPLLTSQEAQELVWDVEVERWLAQTRRGQETAQALNKLSAEFMDDKLAPVEVARALRNMGQDLQRSYGELTTLATEISQQARVSARMAEPYVQRTRRLTPQVIIKLEQHILYMEDLVGRQRLAEAQDAARELARTQERLRDLLQKYKNAGDDETRKKILDEMNALRQQMKELQEKLARLQRDVPQEYVNMDAIQGRDLQDPMKDIDRMLAEGDLEGAAKALERMAKSTQDLLKDMKQGEEEYGGEEFAELREKLQNFKQELEETTAAQEALLQETRARLDKAREKARKELGEDPGKLMDRLQKEADELARQLKQTANQGLMDVEANQRDEAEGAASDVARALKARDLDEALKSSRQTRQALEWLFSSLSDRTEGPFATPSKQATQARGQVDKLLSRAQRLQEQLERFLPNPSHHLSREDREALKEAERKQGRLAQRARQLGQQMETINKEMPLFSPQHRDSLESARRAMQNAEGEMAGSDLPGATGHQREALGRLGEMKKALSEMAQQGGGKGMPMPFGDSSEDGQREGRDGKQHEKVEIPDAEAFKVPQQFRKDILDAMKEAPPSRFQNEVKKYYQELVK